MAQKRIYLPTLFSLFLAPILIVAIGAIIFFAANIPAINAPRSTAAQSLPNPEHVYLTARAAYEAGEFGLAEARFRAALAQDYNRPNWHNGMGLALAKQGRAAEAIEAYELALSFDSKNAIYNYNLALAYRANDDVDRSMTMFKRVTVLAPDSTVAESARRALHNLLQEDK